MCNSPFVCPSSRLSKHTQYKLQFSGIGLRASGHGQHIMELSSRAQKRGNKRDIIKGSGSFLLPSNFHKLTNRSFFVCFLIIANCYFRWQKASRAWLSFSTVYRSEKHTTLLNSQNTLKRLAKDTKQGNLNSLLSSGLKNIILGIFSIYIRLLTVKLIFI